MDEHLFEVSVLWQLPVLEDSLVSVELSLAANVLSGKVFNDYMQTG